MRGKKWEKLFVVALVLVFMFSMTACAAKTEESTENANENSSATVTDETENQEDNEEVEVEGSGEESEEAVLETSEADGFTIAHLSSDTCEVVGCTLGYGEAIDRLVVPDTIDGLTVIGIGSGAFVNNLAKEITLPDTVEYISEKAFYMCDMETINLGSGLKKIEESGILSCNKLTSLTFPDGMESMGASSFSGAGALVEVYIPASVTDIGQDSSGKEVITYPASCPNVVIVTPSGSLAEKVALENKLTVQNP